MNDDFMSEAPNILGAKPCKGIMATLPTPKERPILFSGEMVRAILDGRKTQTRRIVKDRKLEITGFNPKRAVLGMGYWQFNTIVGAIPMRCPYGVTGDRLWVRETFALSEDHETVYYRADHQDDYESDGPWTPSIFMKRIYSRITLEIVKVRVERLQEISARDCVAEGIQEQQQSFDTKVAYSILWDSINGKGAWDKNPWVWVIEFRILTGGLSSPHVTNTHAVRAEAEGQSSALASLPDEKEEGGD